jgi:uncharacterized membrane protein
MSSAAEIEAFVEFVAEAIALGLELATVVIVAIGGILALAGVAKGIAGSAGGRWKRSVWLYFAAWIALSLEFALAADICRTAISPTWDDIGRLAAIAAIRTFLNFFLGRDLEEAETPPTAKEAGA